MSLNFSAITPHSPLLIPSIGRENFKKTEKTQQSLINLANELYASKPDSLIIISSHAPLSEESFLINYSENYQGSLKKFGDFETKLKFRPDSELVAHLKMRAQEENVPLNIVCEPQLDHGSLVPLFWLTKHLPELPVTPIGYSLFDLKQHFNFGILLQKEIQKSTKRIAVIASGDLSHCTREEAPAGYKQEGKIFDDKLVNLLKQKNVPEILNLDPKLIKQASECGLRAIIILLGILNGINYEPQFLSYENPFGVGYLTINFVIK